MVHAPIEPQEPEVSIEPQGPKEPSNPIIEPLTPEDPIPEEPVVPEPIDNKVPVVPEPQVIHVPSKIYEINGSRAIIASCFTMPRPMPLPDPIPREPD